MEEFRSFNRRRFVGSLLKAGALVAITGIPAGLSAANDSFHLTVLHTNDTHSRIDPFPANDPLYAGMGGVARRAELIKNVRGEREHVILLDSGDFFQGTPYFNLFGGEVEINAMNYMQYDAGTIGNHEFDNGAEQLAKQLNRAGFPLVNSNYHTNDSPLNGIIRNYVVLNRGPLKIGVFGLGIELNGLVSSNLIQGVAYTDPVQSAQKTARHLRHEENCHLVICLSHLGYKYDTNKISDIVLAESTSEIDVILGGHTHTFLDTPQIYLNKKGGKVIIAQTGWGGIRLGRIDFEFSGKLTRKGHSGYSVKIS